MGGAGAVLACAGAVLSAAYTLCRKDYIEKLLELGIKLEDKSVSRFARNTVESLKYFRKLKTLGIAVISEKENINTLEQSDQMLQIIFS